MRMKYTPSMWLKRNFTYVLFAICSLSNLSDLRSQNRVEYYYLYTDEFNPNQAEMDAITAALFDVQAWWQIASGGLTFIIDNPDAPIVMALQNNSAFYSSNFVGKIYEEIYNNGPLDEEGDVIKLFFVKGGGGMAAGANACNATGGTAWIGMDLFPEFNTGDYFDCPPAFGGDAWPCTPYGALAHELGHTFSLPHPFPTYPEEIAFHSVMQSHWFYPYTYATEDEDPWSLLSAEREAIQGCPFLVNTSILIPQPYDELPICNLPDNGATPDADFSYSINGTEVTFTNESSGALLYYWTFGNGDVSTEENPEYDFDEDGVYDVRLRATGSNGMMDLAHVQIALCNSMVTSITASDEEICQGEEVTITATGGSEYSWNTGSNNSTIVVDPSQSDDFSVTITAPNGCFVTEEVFIYVFESPEVEIFSSVNNDAICSGESVQLEVVAFDEVLWSTNEIDNEISVSPITTTSYSVTVTNDDGCTGSDNIIIEVFPEPVAYITTSDSLICPGEEVTMTATGGTSYLWSNGLTTGQILVSPDTTSLYSVTVSTGAGCEDETMANIQVWPAATSTITAPSQSCHGDTVYLTGSGNGNMIWSTGDTSDQIQQVIETDTSYTLSVTTVNGCTNVSVATISIFTLSSTSIEASQDSLCFGSTVELTSPLAAHYQWSTGDTTVSIQHIILDTAQVELIAIDSNQCMYELTTDLFLFPSLTLDIQGPAGICQGDSVELRVADGFASYMWSTGSDTTLTSVGIPGQVSVEAIDTFGCAVSDSIILLSDDTENLSISGPAEICKGDTATLVATPGMTIYSWSSGQDSNVIITTSAGIYSVLAAGLFGCTNTDTIQLSVDSIPHFDLILMEDDIIPQGLPLEFLEYLWSDGSTETSLTVLSSGLYCLTVTNELGCSQNECLDVIINANEDATLQNLSLFPNPFTHYLSIEGEFQTEDDVIVYDMLGRKCETLVSRTQKGFRIAPAKNWPEGLYTVHINRGKLSLGTRLALKM